MRRLCGFVLSLSLAVGGWTGSAEASGALRLDEYLRQVLQANHSLQAGIKSVEAAYYAVLSGVAGQRPQAAVSASGSWLSGQSSMGGKESNVTAGSLTLGLTQRIDISGSYSLDERQRILGYEEQRAQLSTKIGRASCRERV